MKTESNFLVGAALALAAANSLGQILPANVIRVGNYELRFGQPTNLTMLNSAAYEDASSITADGLTIFFDSTRAGGAGNSDIWMSTRLTASSPWGVPVNLGSPVNTTANEGDPRISPDGLSLYFGSDRPGTSGPADIWMATRPKRASAFGTPTNLGAAVNSPAEEFGPWISADGLTLLFGAVDRPGGVGGGDIWISTRANRAAHWEPAQNLGAPVNTGNFELFPCLSADGLLLFFTSDRSNPGTGNVWVARRATTASPFDMPIRIGAIGATTDRARPHALSADRTTLYYGSFGSGGQGDWDIWQISMTALPQLQGVTATSGGQIQFDLLGREGINYTIHVSSNMVDWAPWITTNTTDRLRLTDSASQCRRFYQAIAP